MKIFLSYGHDDNAPLIEKIREYLSLGQRHDVWIDNSEIKTGQDWRLKISEGIRQSDIVLAGLSKYSTRNPGVCRNEINISVGVMGGNIKTILLEPADIVAAPAMLSHIQWLDMSDWKAHEAEGFESEYFQRKFHEIADMVNTPENERFNGDITRLKEKLHPISSMARIQSLTQKKMYGREWLYKKIEEWDKQNEQRIFWIVGGPGFGKSTFAANLQQTYNAQIPAIQFVEWGKPDHSNPCAILRNLAFQLAVRYHDYLRQLLDLPQLDNLLNMNENELFDILFCESMFLRIDGGHENIWVLIDALDEANDENGNRIVQTIARHIERLPKWMKFILTSRDDSKVRLPLQQFKPQVFDLEDYVKNKNSEDLELYLRSKLKEISPTENQVKYILGRSQGVFLYLSLCVEGLLKGEYSLNRIEELPNGLNGYYAQFFDRQFGNDIGYYKRIVRPILQIMVASYNHVSLPFLQYVSGIESDAEFNDAILSIEHLFRFTDIQKQDTTHQNLRRVSFFHNSIENWLTNQNESLLYYVSREDGRKQLSECFVYWLNSKENDHNSLWLSYGSGLRYIANITNVISQEPDLEKMQALMYVARTNASFGRMTKDVNHYQGLINQYCKACLNDEKDLTNFIIDMFEAIKEWFLKTGVISPERRTFQYQDVEIKPADVADSACGSAVLGVTLRSTMEYTDSLTPNTAAILANIVDVLAFYNMRLSEKWLDQIKHPSSLEDLCYYVSRELSDIHQMIRNKYNIPSKYDIVDIYQKALAERHPKLYPPIMNIGGISFRVNENAVASTQETNTDEDEKEKAKVPFFLRLISIIKNYVFK